MITRFLIIRSRPTPVLLNACAIMLLFLSCSAAYGQVEELSAAEVIGTVSNATSGDAVNDFLIAYGYGDGGGGPTDELVQKAQIFGGFPGTPRLRVTIAWDDAPGAENADPALVNDLDLVLIDPDYKQRVVGLLAEQGTSN